MNLEEFLTSLCNRLTDFFFRSFGDDTDSKSDDIVINGDVWTPAISLSNAAILVMTNTDLANEIQLTWNKDNAIGFRLAAGASLTLDGVSGILYAKCAAGLSATLNYMSASIRK